jgi:hypothetical protein
MKFNKMKKINEQTNPSTDVMTTAFNAGCFSNQKYTWFTIDNDKQPKTTKSGKKVITGKNTKGDPVWFYQPDAGKSIGVYKNMTTKNQKIWECSDVSGNITGSEDKDKFVKDFLEKNKDHKEEKPSDFLIGTEWEKIDLSTIKPELFKPNERFIYKRIGSVNTKIQQQPEIEKVLNSAGYTLIEPAVTSFTHDKNRDIRNIAGGKYKNYYDVLSKDGQPVNVWPVEGKETITPETAKQTLQNIKSKEISKSNCKDFIKTLMYYKRTNADIDDKDLIPLKDKVWQCKRQGTKFTSGIFGLEDELQNLSQDYGRYGLGEYLKDMNESKTNLKTIIKENLKTKKSSLITENTIISNRLNVILEEGKPNTNKELDKFYNNIIEEMVFFNSQDYSTELISEGLIDMVKSFFGSASEGILQTLKEKMITWILEKLGIPTNNTYAKFFIVAAGNLDVADIPKLTNCSFLTKFLSKTVVEATVKKFQGEGKASGAFFDMMRNTMIDAVEQSSFGQTLEHKLSDLICGDLLNVKSKMDTIGDELKQKALS